MLCKELLSPISVWYLLIWYHSILYLWTLTLLFIWYNLKSNVQWWTKWVMCLDINFQWWVITEKCIVWSINELVVFDMINGVRFFHILKLTIKLVMKRFLRFTKNIWFIIEEILNFLSKEKSIGLFCGSKAPVLFQIEHKELI